MIDLSGVLDTDTVGSFDNELEQILGEQTKTLILRIENLSYISSAGIGSIMDWTQRLRSRGGELALVKPSAKVCRILDLLGLSSILAVAESDEEALAGRA